MALDDKVHSVELEGTTFQFFPMKGTDVLRCAWKLTSPASSVLNGPVQIGFTIIQMLKEKGMWVTGEKFDLKSLLTLDISEVQPFIKALTESLQDLSKSMSVEEFVDLVLVMFKGMDVMQPKSAPVKVVDADTYDQAFSGIMPDAIFVLMLEVMRFNRFPFLRRVTGDFGQWLQTINTLSEESTTENED